MYTEKQTFNILNNMLILLIYCCKCKKDGNIPIRKYLPFFEEMLFLVENQNSKEKDFN